MNQLSLKLVLYTQPLDMKKTTKSKTMSTTKHELYFSKDYAFVKVRHINISKEGFYQKIFTLQKTVLTSRCVGVPRPHSNKG